MVCSSVLLHGNVLFFNKHTPSNTSNRTRIEISSVMRALLMQHCGRGYHWCCSGAAPPLLRPLSVRLWLIRLPLLRMQQTGAYCCYRGSGWSSTAVLSPWQLWLLLWLWLPSPGCRRAAAAAAVTAVVTVIASTEGCTSYRGLSRYISATSTAVVLAEAQSAAKASWNCSTVGSAGGGTCLSC